MSTLYRATLLLHIAAGLVGLAAFWAPALARKGGTLHKRAGRLFFRATCLVACTGLMMAVSLLVDPLAIHPPRRPVSPAVEAAIASNVRLTVPFLLYLLLITFVPVYHGVRVLATRRDPGTLRTPFHTAINLTTIGASVAMIGLAILLRQPVFAAMSPIGLLVGPGNLQFARRPYPSPMAWWYEHMGSMIGGGIAFHTAFLVLGAGRLFGLRFEAGAAALTWIMPTLIGIPASAIWVRYYRRKFGELRPSAIHAPAASRS
jgi:hypothetical protein